MFWNCVPCVYIFHCEIVTEFDDGSKRLQFGSKRLGSKRPNSSLVMELQPVQSTACRSIQNVTEGVITTRSNRMKFRLFHLMMKHCIERLILLLEQNDFRRRVFQLISKHSLNNYFLSLWISDEFEIGSTIHFVHDFSPGIFPQCTRKLSFFQLSCKNDVSSMIDDGCKGCSIGSS